MRFSDFESIKDHQVGLVLVGQAAGEAIGSVHKYFLHAFLVASSKLILAISESGFIKLNEILITDRARAVKPVSYTHLTLPTKRIV